MARPGHLAVISPQKSVLVWLYDDAAFNTASTVRRNELFFTVACPYSGASYVVTRNGVGWVVPADVVGCSYAQ